MIASFLISTIINPLLIWINWKQERKRKLSTILFMMLACSDLVTNIIKPIRVATNLLTTDILPVVRNGTRIEQLETLLFQVASLSSMVLTTLISVCRFLSVRSPFLKIPCKFPIGIFIIFGLYSLAYSFQMVVGFENRMKKGKVLWFLHCQLIFSFEKSGYGTNWFYL